MKFQAEKHVPTRCLQPSDSACLWTIVQINPRDYNAQRIDCMHAAVRCNRGL